MCHIIKSLRGSSNVINSNAWSGSSLCMKLASVYYSWFGIASSECTNQYNCRSIVVYLVSSIHSWLDECIFTSGLSMPLWKAVLIDYIHTLAICGIMMKKLLRRFVVEDCPVSIWLILIRLLNSTLFSMSNLPIITRALFILSIPMSVPYFIQLIATYTTYTVLVAVLFHWQILYKDTAINMMACQTAASFYILLSLFYVLRKAIRRPQ
jgi:hypothetical protein